MPNIYIVRHCKAEGQAADAKLTETGVEQAAKLAEFLSEHNIDCIVSSPFERARSSIMPLAVKLGLEVALDDRLTERVLSDKSHPEWRDMLRRSFDEPELQYEGGESGNTAMRRAVSVIKELIDSGCNNAVIVSHGNLIALLLKHFDATVGFKEWEALSNPDVHRLSFGKDGARVERIWAE